MVTISLKQSTRLPSEEKSRIQILQGTLDLIVLRTLRSLGPLHAYGIAARLEQVSGDLLKLNQGTLYPALVRLEQQGWIKGKWDTTENGREAKYYAITKAGLKALGEEIQRWRQLSGLMPAPDAARQGRQVSQRGNTLARQGLEFHGYGGHARRHSRRRRGR